MHDRELYAKILGIQHPWSVCEVSLDLKALEVNISVEAASDGVFHCPECGGTSRRYDTVKGRQWRHLDTCQYKTILTAAIPRVECETHGVHQVKVPWAEPNSRFTALFEALAIDWLKEASTSAVAGLLRLTWQEVDGIMQRAVERGLARREVTSPKAIGVDETSFQKRHQYVTVVVNLEGNKVLHVADDRKASSLAEYLTTLSPEQLNAINVIAMDMHDPFIKAAMESVPEAEKKICFDRYHVAKLIGDGVDRVRKEEHAALMAKGDYTLKGTKHLWLTASENLKGPVMEGMYDALKGASLKTGRAHALKELARSLWNFAKRGWAEKAWTKWIGWAMRSKLEPMKRAAESIKRHLWGIINAIVLRATNAATESINAKIQWIKRTACGFRNRERFKRAIYFHLGGLDLYPASLQTTHTNN